MAWPNTPYETCTANVTVVHADLATAIQSAINRLYTGTYSIKSIAVDGAGGSVITSLAGTVKVSAAGTTTVVNTLPIPAGAIYKGSVLLGWASVDFDGTFLRGLNVFSVVKDGGGLYTVTFDVNPGDPGNCAATASCRGDGALYMSTTKCDVAGGKLTVQVGTGTSTSNFTNQRFTVHVFGE